MILAIDPSLTCTGWAVGVPGRAASGRKSFVVATGQPPALRYTEFSKWLHGLIAKYRPDKVVFETARAMSSDGHATMVSMGLRTRIEEVCAQHGIPAERVMASDLKKRATGNGNAEKPAMKAVAKKLFGPIYDMEGDKGGDEADALCLLALKLDMLPSVEVKAKKPRKRKGA